MASDDRNIIVRNTGTIYEVAKDVGESFLYNIDLTNWIADRATLSYGSVTINPIDTFEPTVTIVPNGLSDVVLPVGATALTGTIFQILVTGGDIQWNTTGIGSLIVTAAFHNEESKEVELQLTLTQN